MELAAGFTLKVVAGLDHDLIGTWRLVSRIDRDESGRPVDEPTLGSNPVALLFFDDAGNFAAQFMKRDRGGAVAAPVSTGQNNTTAIGGYDAYFGTYGWTRRAATCIRAWSARCPPVTWGRP